MGGEGPNAAAEALESLSVVADMSESMIGDPCIENGERGVGVTDAASRARTVLSCKSEALVTSLPEVERRAELAAAAAAVAEMAVGL